jgi:acetyl esterase/lipase
MSTREMSTTTTSAPVLEAPAKGFADATANPPFLSDLAPAEGRKLVDEVQSGEIAKPDVDEQWVTVAGGPTGEVKVRIVTPRGAKGTLPVVLYIHGAGWVFGDAHTHDRLVRELAVGVGAAVVFPEYDRSPERATRSRSSRTTPSRGGLSRKAPRGASTRAGSPWRATRSAAT